VKQPVIIRTGHGRPLAVVGETIEILADGQRTEGQEIFMQTGPVNAGPPAHHHPWDESFFVVEGNVEFQVGDQRHKAEPGTLVFVPANTTHAFRFLTPGARFLSFTSRPAQAQFFTEMNRDLKRPDDMPTMMAVCARNQVSVDGPPLAEG
jgi:quercetin dioxygenase-like cupin family protein